jgi:polyhydroxyalkanoate synthesis regulator phasin
MKRSWKIVGIAAIVTILGVAAVGAVVYAQDDGSGGPFDFHGKFREAIAEILGISADEYEAAVEKARDQVVDEALTEGWLTEEQAELLQWRMDRAPSVQMPGISRGMRELGRGLMGGGDGLLSIAAGELDMSLTDLLAELEDGKSIADVAEEKGVNIQVIVDAYLAQIQENLDEAVAEGNMTQTQANYRLQQAEERVSDLIDNAGLGGLRDGGRHRGPKGFPGPGGF